MYDTLTPPHLAIRPAVRRTRKPPGPALGLLLLALLVWIALHALRMARRLAVQGRTAVPSPDPTLS